MKIKKNKKNERNWRRDWRRGTEIIFGGLVVPNVYAFSLGRFALDLSLQSRWPRLLH